MVSLYDRDAQDVANLLPLLADLLKAPEQSEQLGSAWVAARAWRAAWNPTMTTDVSARDFASARLQLIAEAIREQLPQRAQSG